MTYIKNLKKDNWSGFMFGIKNEELRLALINAFNQVFAHYETEQKEDSISELYPIMRRIYESVPNFIDLNANDIIKDFLSFEVLIPCDENLFSIGGQHDTEAEYVALYSFFYKSKFTDTFDVGNNNFSFLSKDTFIKLIDIASKDEKYVLANGLFKFSKKRFRTNSEVGSHHWSATLTSFIIRVGEYLNDHGADAAHDATYREWGEIIKEHATELNDYLHTLPDVSHKVDGTVLTSLKEVLIDQKAQQIKQLESEIRGLLHAKTI